jgi:hypothetical protein
MQHKKSRARHYGVASTLIAGAALANMPAAHAQGYVFTTTFAPNPIPDIFSDGDSEVDIANGSSSTGAATPSSVTLSTLTAVSNASAGSPDEVTSRYTIVVTLQQAGIGGAGFGPTVSETFYGQVFANLSSTAVTPVPGKPQNEFHSTATSNDNLAMENQIYNLGGSVRYEVDINSYTPFGSPSVGSPGTIGATVTFITPEPGVFGMLAGLGFSGSLIGYRRRRRRTV